jgi:membrane associated rhomboid family serine protease
VFFIPYSTAESRGRQRFPYVNVLLVLANLIVFIIEISVLASQGESGFANFIHRYSFQPSQFDTGWLQPTILTAMFMHAGFLHIIGNMMFLLPFGDNVEDRLGHIRYLLFYLICGVAATVIFALFNRHSNVPLLGASGAIAGVLGGYLALYPTGSRVKGFFFLIIIFFRIELPAILFIGYWFVMQLFSSIASLGAGASAQAQGGGVAFLAHVGGFVVGLMLAPLLANNLPKSQQSVSL